MLGNKLLSNIAFHFHFSAAIGSCCIVSVLLESEPTPFCQAGRWFRSAALHGTQNIRNCSNAVALFSLRESETKCLSIEGSTATDPFSLPRIYRPCNLFTLKLSQYCKSGNTALTLFPKVTQLSKQVVVSIDCSRLGNALSRPVCVLATSCQSDLPKLCLSAHKSSILWLPFGIAFGNDWGKMTCRGSDLDTLLTAAAWPTSSKRFICSEIP